jgi:anion-transporting  ArsA/GET3 family ATPase
MMPGIAELTLLGRLYYFAELDVEDRFDIVILDGYASGHFHSLMKTPDAVLHSGMMGPVIDETQRVRAYIADPQKTAVVLVAVAEDLVVSEALDFVNKLQAETPAPLAAVMLNRTYPPFPGQLNPEGYPAELEPGIDYWRERANGEQAAIERLHEGLAQFESKFSKTLPLYRLPEVGAFSEPVPKDELLAWLQAAVRV